MKKAYEISKQQQIADKPTSIWKLLREIPDSQRICCICGGKFLPDDVLEHVETNRGSSLFMHEKCAKWKENADGS